MRFRTLLLLSLLFALLGKPANSQTTQIAPDCTIPFSFTLSAQRAPSSGFQNFSTTGQSGCVVWVVSYRSQGFSAVSLRVESAADTVSGSSHVPSTWVAFLGDILDGNACGATSGPGVNPNTDTNCGYTMLKGAPAWVSVTLTSKTGSGSISGNLLGWRPHGSDQTSSSGGGGVTSDVNLVEVGGNAVVTGGVNGSQGVGGLAGATASAVGNPVRIGGKDGSGNIQDFKIDTQGNNYNYLGCNATAEVALSGTGYVEIVAGTASQVIKVCKVLVTSVSGGNPTVNTFSVASATITSCASPTELALYGAVTGVADDWGGALASASGKSICVSESVANSDKVTISYQKATF